MQLSLREDYARHKEGGVTAANDCLFCALERELFRQFKFEIAETVAEDGKKEPTLVPCIDRATSVRAGVVRGLTAADIARAVPKTSRGRKARKNSRSAPSERGAYLIRCTGAESGQPATDSAADRAYKLRQEKQEVVLSQLCREHSKEVLRRRQAADQARDAHRPKGGKKQVQGGQSTEEKDLTKIKQALADFKKWQSETRGEDDDGFDLRSKALMAGALKLAGNDDDLAARYLAQAHALIKRPR